MYFVEVVEYSTCLKPKMNEGKLIGLQMQVRQNQQELMDYVKELDDWGEEMKDKEQQLKLETQSCSEVSLIFRTSYDGIEGKTIVPVHP